MMRVDDACGFATPWAADVEEFQPLEPGSVRMYSCGPTVYGPAHVGNFRAFSSPICSAVTSNGRATRSRG